MNPKFKSWALSLALTLPCLDGRAQQPEPSPQPGPIPAEELFKNPAFRSPLISQSGVKMAAIFDTDQDQSGLLIFDLETKKQQRILGSKGRDTDSISWLGDENLLVSQSKDKIYSEGVYLVSANEVGKNHPVVLYSVASLIGTSRERPLEPYVWIRKDAYNEGRDYGPVQLNAKLHVNPGEASKTPWGVFSEGASAFIETHGTAAAIKETLVPLKEGIPVDYIGDRTGKPAYAISSVAGRFVLFYFKGGAWVRSPFDSNLYGFIDRGEAPFEIIVTGRAEVGKPDALLRMNVETGVVSGTLYQDAAYDCEGAWLYRHPKTDKIMGLGLIRAYHENIWFDPEMVEVQKKITALLPGSAMNVLGYNDELSKVVIAAYSDVVSTVYLRYEKGGDKLIPVAATRAGLEKWPALHSQWMRYKSRDGFRIEAVLTLPRGASKEHKVPLIVLPHGGPRSRGIHAWNPEAQFFASRGYAVLMPNYRGSTGTRWQYPISDHWNFRKMHEDVTDGVRKMIATGLVDPKRVAIMGTSFGGYLAVCGAAWEPELYRCSIAIAGVYDWRAHVMARKYDRFDDARFDLMVDLLGDPSANAEKYAELSPLKDVGNIRIPVFVAHGKEDNVVDFEQSKLLVSALERSHIPHRKFFRRAEGHGMYNLENQVEMMTQIEAFLAENMK